MPSAHPVETHSWYTKIFSLVLSSPISSSLITRAFFSVKQVYQWHVVCIMLRLTLHGLGGNTMPSVHRSVHACTHVTFHVFFLMHGLLWVYSRDVALIPPSRTTLKTAFVPHPPMANRGLHSRSTLSSMVTIRQGVARRTIVDTHRILISP